MSVETKPGGGPTVGQTASRTRQVSKREVTSPRVDKPITGLDVSVTRDDGTLAVSGRAVVYTVPLPRA